MAEEKMSLIEELQNPPRVDGGGLDEGKVIDLMKTAAFALSTMIGVASKAAAQTNGERPQSYRDDPRPAKQIIEEDNWPERS